MHKVQTLLLPHRMYLMHHNGVSSKGSISWQRGMSSVGFVLAGLSPRGLP